MGYNVFRFFIVFVSNIPSLLDFLWPLLMQIFFMCLSHILFFFLLFFIIYANSWRNGETGSDVIQFWKLYYKIHSQVTDMNAHILQIINKLSLITFLSFIADYSLVIVKQRTSTIGPFFALVQGKNNNNKLVLLATDIPPSQISSDRLMHLLFLFFSYFFQFFFLLGKEQKQRFWGHDISPWHDRSPPSLQRKKKGAPNWYEEK